MRLIGNIFNISCRAQRRFLKPILSYILIPYQKLVSVERCKLDPVKSRDSQSNCLGFPQLAGFIKVVSWSHHNITSLFTRKNISYYVQQAPWSNIIGLKLMIETPKFVVYMSFDCKSQNK